MAREIIGFLLVLLVLSVAFRIRRSVSERRKIEETRLSEPSEAIGGLEIGKALYVATVYASDPLKKVWAHGLGARGRAKVFASEGGISVERAGERDFAILSEQLRGLTRESATIDKGVEPGGLIAIHWRLGDEDLITHLRVAGDQQVFYTSLTQNTGGI